MALSRWLSQSVSSGTFKWNGNIEDLMKYFKEILGVNEDDWLRTDGPNGDPFNCKIGDDISIRWFPTTHTLQLRGKQADSVKQKLIQSIADEQELTEADDDIQSSRHVVETIATNANLTSDATKPHCCCANMLNELADIRIEIAAFRGEHQCEVEENGKYEEMERLRAELAEKERVIRNLEDERNSYQVALNLLTKEFAASELKKPNKENQDEKERSFTVVSNKKKRKQKPAPKPADQRSTRKENVDRTQTTNDDNVSPSRSTQDRRHKVIVGDSIIKNVEGWRVSRSTKTKTTIKSFPGASVADCYHYFKPTLDRNPEEIVIHVGTNDLKTNSARSTAESIVDLATWTASGCSAARISISEITTRHRRR